MGVFSALSETLHSFTVFVVLMKKVLQVLWSGNTGGSERHVLELVTHLPAYDYTPAVCFLTTAGTMGDLLNQMKIPWFEIGMRHTFDAIRLLKFRKIFQRENFDLIHEHGGNKIAVDAYRLFSPESCTLFTIHNGESISAYQKLRLCLEMRKMKRFDRLLCVSKIRAEEWSAQVKRPVFYEPNGIDILRFYPRTNVCESEKKILIAVGRLIATKRFELLIDLLEPVFQDDRIILQIVGEGEERPHLMQLIAERKLEKWVQLLGERSDIPELFHKADLFVFASAVEAFPLVFLEAGASELPVVAVDLPGMSELICDGKTGFLISENSAKADFPEKVQMLLKDVSTRKAMGKAARELVQNRFSSQRMTARLVNHYDALLNKR